MKINFGWIEFAVILAGIFLFGYGLGSWHQSDKDVYGNYSDLDVEEIEFGLEVYRSCMQSGSRTGCRMSVEDFVVYHSLRHELARRSP